ncbi:DUF4435 domain-containing protein [Sphingobacterium athyrii]|uniref:DUF4435 domain-containing protein n=1 Tax=Sphingobacterium athyrii TaxID=2152717 RepID=A0A363NWI2_9SPHI|nr:DUF4435 domain-containing protein [Sphingobacterium athyrii]PUV25154.1 hypothetical protein DCO56_09450 [Sphingobacterium athyrii]
MSSLIENLTSNFISAINSLKPSNSKKMIKVYVESDPDITHWNQVFCRFNLMNVEFDFSLPNKDHYEKGKQNIFKNFKDNLGENLIICVDSDYDFLIPDLNENSSIINNSDFVFQTYSYSIENLYCYHESLLNFCVGCLNKADIKIDLAKLLIRYSNIIYDLLVWNIYLYSIKQHEDFSIENFVEICKILTVDDFENNYDASFECLNTRVRLKLNQLEQAFPHLQDKIEDYKSRLQKKGIESDNCYIYANGHLILSNVVLMFLRSIVSNEKRIKLFEIEQKCLHETHKKEEARKYKSGIIENKSIEGHIYRNFQFYNSHTYKLTEKKIQDFIKKYNLN